MLQKFKAHYGEEIFISPNINKEVYICNKNTADEIVKNYWKDNVLSTEEKRRKTVLAAADIIVEDIKSSDNVENDVPETLKLLVDGIVLKHKKK